MQNKHKKTSFNVRLKTYSSDSKFKRIQNHSLNKSPTKNVPTFNTGGLRFPQTYSISPNKFYDLPQFKAIRSASFGFGTKTNFAKKQFVEPTRYKINSSFEINKNDTTLGSTFGISRQDFYKGKMNKSSPKLGPGIYNLQSARKKNSFYMGLKIKRKDETISPGPGTYNIQSDESLKNLKSSILKIRGPRIKTEYFQKRDLQKFDNRVPGPGAYQLNSSTSLMMLQRSFIKKPKLPQCPRFKVRQERKPAPGSQQVILLSTVNCFHNSVVEQHNYGSKEDFFQKKINTIQKREQQVQFLH